MVQVWETWILAGLGALQLLVAYAWYKGPYLDRTRGWVTGLFLLNGSATLIAATGVPEEGILNLTQLLMDRWTNLFLLGVGLVALNRRDKAHPLEAALLVAATAAMLAVTVGRIRAFGARTPTWIPNLRNIVLWVAILAGGVALTRWTRKRDHAHSTLWVLLLAGLGLRYAELTTLYAPLATPQEVLTGTWLARIDGGLRLLGFAAMAIAALTLLVHRSSPREDRDQPLYDLGLILVLSGFLFGFARNVSPGVSTFTVYLSLALVRPMVFLGVQSRLTGRTLTASLPLKPLKHGTGIVACGTLGALLAPGLGIQNVGIWATSLMGALFGFALTTTIPIPLPATTAPRSQATPPDWSIEHDRVQLPQGWETRIEDAYDAYLDLPTTTQETLDEIPRWQRILLALEGAPEGDELPAYERTTPGLHLATQCPYASIGPEINRTNQRADRILDELGLPHPTPRDDDPLIEASYGRAQGLDSPRAKHYTLTPIGETVAASLREEIGLGDRPPEQVRHLVGEDFEPATP